MSKAKDLETEFGWKWRLEPFAIQFKGLLDCLESKNLEELMLLREACDKAGMCNCWYATYQAAKFLKPLVDEEIRKTQRAIERGQMKKDEVQKQLNAKQHAKEVEAKREGAT